MLSALNSPVKLNEHYNDEATDCSMTSTSAYIVEDRVATYRKTAFIKPKNPQEPNVLIVKRIDDDESTELSLKLIDILGASNSKVFVEEASFAELEQKKPSNLETKFYPFELSEDANIDLLITIGGDGTVLWAMQYFNKTAAPPILAYSKGTRNYLCNFSKEGSEASLKKVMEDISNGKALPIEQRDRLQCEIKDTETGKKEIYQALNEVTISRGGVATLAKVDCYIEERYLATFEGDGVMIATPTGSTAYQLSAGGPVVNHLTSSMTITPIAPINLTTRPVVLPTNLQLSLKMNKESRKNISLNIDGQVQVELNKQTEINIIGAPNPLCFLLPETGDVLDNWIFRLRNLVGWNKNASHF